MAMPRIRDFRAYIEERSIPEPMSGCWIWMLSLTAQGYGQATLQERKRVARANRVAFEAFNGPIPVGALIQHSCDSPWCVAPHHLRLGTHLTNNGDRARKGRSAHKLTDDDVRAIRMSTQPSYVLAASYGVSVEAVRRARIRRTWRHVV